MNHSIILCSTHVHDVAHILSLTPVHEDYVSVDVVLNLIIVQILKYYCNDCTSQPGADWITICTTSEPGCLIDYVTVCEGGDDECLWTILRVHTWVENGKCGLWKKVSSSHENEAMESVTQTAGGEWRGRPVWFLDTEWRVPETERHRKPISRSPIMSLYSLTWHTSDLKCAFDLEGSKTWALTDYCLVRHSWIFITSTLLWVKTAT